MTKQELALVYGYSLIAANSASLRLFPIAEMYLSVESRLSDISFEEAPGVIREAAAKVCCLDCDNGSPFADAFELCLTDRTPGSDVGAIDALKKHHEDIACMERIFAAVL